MKAKLKKESDGNYTLILNNPKECPYSLPLLSKQNCDKMFGVTDVEKLAEEQWGNVHRTGELGYIEGFNKAMELNKDKLFTEDDVNLAFVLGKNKDESRINKLINSKIQPTEIEVEIEMECKIGCEHIVFNGENSLCCGDKTPKLDSDGCLILK